MTGDDEISRSGEYSGENGPSRDQVRPYENVDVASLPEWWQRAIEHFEERDIAPYRPPRFEDGTITPPVVHDLEDDLDVTIGFRCKNATVGADWTVTVDGEPIGQLGRHRSRDRYTVFEITAREFRTWIHASVAPSSKVE